MQVRVATQLNYGGKGKSEKWNMRLVKYKQWEVYWDMGRVQILEKAFRH